MSDTLAHVAEVPPRVPDAKKTGTARLIGGYVLRVLLCLVFGLPLVFLFVSSLKPDIQIFGDVGTVNAFLPVGDISLDNYTAVFNRVPFWRFMMNSVVLSALTVILGADQTSARRIADQAGQVQADFRLQAERRNRYLATALQSSRHRAFGGDAHRRIGIVQRLEQISNARVAFAIFDRNRTLRRCRQPTRRIQAVADTCGQPQSIQARTRKHYRVVIAGVELGQARVDVAAQIDGAQIRA